MTYRYCRLAVLHSKVRRGDQWAQVAARYVAAEREGTETDAGGSKVRGRREVGRLVVDDEDVSVRTRAFGGARTGVVGAECQYNLSRLGNETHTEVEPSQVTDHPESPSVSLAPLTSQWRVWLVLLSSVPTMSASTIMTV